MTECDFVEVEPGVLRCTYCRRRFPKPAVMPLHAACPSRTQRPKPPEGGVGTELTKLLRKFGIKHKAGCGCDAREKMMNEFGIRWCEANFGKLVDEMVVEGKARGWVWVPRWGASRLLARAIRNAKVKHAKHGT